MATTLWLTMTNYVGCHLPHILGCAQFTVANRCAECELFAAIGNCIISMIIINIIGNSISAHRMANQFRSGHAARLGSTRGDAEVLAWRSVRTWQGGPPDSLPTQQGFRLHRWATDSCSLSIVFYTLVVFYISMAASPQNGASCR